MGCSESTVREDVDPTEIPINENGDVGIVLDDRVTDGFIQTFWPVLRTVTEGMMRKEIIPALNQMTSLDIKLTTFSIGTVPPSFGTVTLTQPEHPFRFRIKLPLTWHSDHEISAVVYSIPIGIKDLKIEADILVDQGPVLDKMPIIGGIALCMPDVPKIDFDLTGIANVAEIPGIRGLVFKLIEDTLANLIVLPNRVAIPIGKRDDLENPVQLFYPPPAGLLKVKVHKATNLPSHDWFDAADPYVTVKVGYHAKQWTSQTKWDKANPVWEEVTHIFPCYAMCQKVIIRVFDKDNLSWHDEIGEIPNLQVGDAILQEGAKDFQLYDPQGKPIPNGFVNLGFDWKVMKEITTNPTGKDDDLFILSVAIDQLHPEKSKKLQEELTIKYKIHLDDEVLEQEVKKKPEILDSEEDHIKFVRMVLQKLEEKKMSDAVASDITGLSVEEIRNMKRTHSADVVRDYEIAHQAHFYLKKKDALTKSVHIELSSKELNERMELSIMKHLSKDELETKKFKLKDGVMMTMRMRLNATGDP